MVSVYSSKYKVLGFGRTQAEADQELAFYIARQDIDTPEGEAYRYKRDLLYPWNPLPNILHIKGVGAIVRDGNTLTNTRTGQTVEIEHLPMSHYLYLFRLIGDYVTFEEFTISMKKEIDAFFRAISYSYGSLEDFPFVQPGYVSTASEVTHLENRCYVCTTSIPNEILVSDGTRLLSIQAPNPESVPGITAYGFAKLGLIYDGKNVIPCRKDQRSSPR